jgi:predicted permease
MTTGRDSSARRWFRRLLSVLPFDTRRDYGRDMEDVFMLERDDRASGGATARGRLWAASVGGILAFASREQWAATRSDLRQAARGWRRAPLLFAVLIATMAAGMAGVTTAFAVVDAVLLRPLPISEPATLVRVGEVHPDAGRLTNVTYATFFDLEARLTSLSSVSASRFWFVNLTGEGSPERLRVALVSGNFFGALGAPPEAGRLLAPEDDHAGRDSVAVVSYGLWQRRFGGDPSIIGRTILLNEQPTQVVGVLRNGAEFPLGTDAWVPLTARDSGLDTNRRAHLLEVIGRLRPGVSRGTVATELETIAGSIETAEPGADPDLGLHAEPLLDRVVAPVRTALWIVLVAACVLLVVLAINVAQVQLARARGREREFAVRTALGASRGRLARLLLTESVALAAIAGVLGVATAWLLTNALPAWLPPDLPRAADIAFDWRVAVLGLAVALLTGIGFGLWPVARTSALARTHGWRIVGGSSLATARGMPGRIVAAAQLALTFALLVVATLIVRSAFEVARVPLGFSTDGLVRVDMSLPSSRVSDPSDGDAYAAVLDPLVNRLTRIPGVTAAGLSTTAPLAGGAATSFVVLGETVEEGREPLADIRIVDTGFFDTLDVPLVAGRTFTADDRARSRPVMVVSDTLARRHFPDGRVVGRSITMLNWGPPLTAEVVGVVGDLVGQDPEAPLTPTIYWHYPQFPQVFTLTLFVKTTRDEASIVPDVRAAIWELEPNLPLPRIEPMSSTVRDARAQRRTLTALLVGLATAAAIFALVGLYGVLAHKAARETSAHGVRMALGARPADIARLVVNDALQVAALGVVVGAALAAIAGRAIEGLLFQTSPRDANAFAAAGALLVVAVVAAALVPAWRASRVDPIVALRQQ